MLFPFFTKNYIVTTLIIIITPRIFQVPGKTTIFSISDIELGPVLYHKYALTGQVWSAIREHYPQNIRDILKKGVVFARMSSDQKQQVIQELQTMGYYVGECIYTSEFDSTEYIIENLSSQQNGDRRKCLRFMYPTQNSTGLL